METNRKKVASIVVASAILVSGIGVSKSFKGNDMGTVSSDVRYSKTVENDTLSDAQIKEEVKNDIEARKYTVSYLTGLYLGSDTKYGYIFDKDEGFIDKDAYDAGVTHSKKSIKNDKELKNLEGVWSCYIKSLKEPDVEYLKLSESLGTYEGTMDALVKKNDQENNDLYQDYKNLLDYDIYTYYYGKANDEWLDTDLNSKEQARLENSIKQGELKLMIKLSNYVNNNRYLFDKYKLYFSSFELGQADEFYKIVCKEDLIQGLSNPGINVNCSPSAFSYLGYYDGTDYIDKVYLENKAKKR